MIDSIKEQDGMVIISLSGTFNFIDQAAFRKSYEDQIKGQSKKYILDFRKVKFIDSSALGMILLLNDYVSDTAMNKITLRNSSQEVLDIFKVANFQKLFHISP